jgi:hypothetical protein
MRDFAKALWSAGWLHVSPTKRAAQDGPTLIRVITEPRQNAQAHGDRGLEVHVVAPEVSLSQATKELRRNPVPYQSWLGTVVVHVRGGYFVVPSSGAP